MAAPVASLGLGNSSLCQQQHPWAKQFCFPNALKALYPWVCLRKKWGFLEPADPPVGEVGLLHPRIWATCHCSLSLSSLTDTEVMMVLTLAPVRITKTHTLSTYQCQDSRVCVVSIFSNSHSNLRRWEWE